MKKDKHGRKCNIFIFDIETAPLTVYTWGIRKQYIDLPKLKTDWFMLSWAGKWAGDKKVLYKDSSKSKDITNDKPLVVDLWKCLNEADVVVGHSINNFDLKKFNARAIMLGLPPVAPFKTVDTAKEARRVFGFSSNKLDYLSHKLNRRYKKLSHNKYPGMALWVEILNGNRRAWKDMKEYNIHDVLATEELYHKLFPWIQTPRLNAFINDRVKRCPYCLSTKLILKGPVYTDFGKFQGYKCNKCGKRPRGKTNLYDAKKRKELLK